MLPYSSRRLRRCFGGPLPFFNGLLKGAVLAVCLINAAAAQTLSFPAPFFPDPHVGEPYSFQLEATGGTTPYRWSRVSGTLPTGFTLNTNGLISGTASSTGTFRFRLAVTDRAGVTQERDTLIYVSVGTLTISTNPPPGATALQSYSYSLTAAGGRTPYSWSLTGGSLPAGLALSTGGVISGVPASAGSSTFSVRVTDSTGQTNAATFTMTVAAGVAAPAPSTLSMGSTFLPDGRVGAAYSQTLSATGGVTPYSWRVSSGSLPTGLLLSTAGVISGTPAVAGTFRFQVRLADAAGAAVVRDTMIYVAVAPVAISTTPLPAGTVQQSYSHTLQATGGTAPYQWSLSAGTLPAGLTLSAGGVISGTPSAAATSSFTVRAADTTGQAASGALTLTVNPSTSLSIAAPSWPNVQVNTAFSYTLTATGGTAPYRWSLTSGTIPPGLALSQGGVLSGTPTTAGSYTFQVTATDGRNRTASRSLSMSVAAALAITTNTVPDGVVQQSYNQTLQATGGRPPYTWQGGALPAGLTFSSGGVLSGRPTVAGTFSLSLRATDSVGSSVVKAFTLVIRPGSTLTISTATMPAAVTGSPYSHVLTGAGGTPPYTWSVAAGALPAGLSLNTSTGAVAGIPTTAGSFSFTAGLRDATTTTPVTRALSITVAGALSITTTTLPDGALSSAYTQTLAATGGSAPYTWRLANGVLPAGLSLSTAGTISGTPTATGTFNFRVQATDSGSATATRDLTLLIGPARTSTLSVTSPAAGAVLTGMVNFAVSTPPPAGGSIEYLLNGKAFSGPIYAPPFTYAWNSSLAWNSVNTVEAISRDAAGAEMARSPLRSFSLAHKAGQVSIASPDPSRVQSGTVNWTVNASSPDGTEGWSFLLNGAFNMMWGNATSRTMTLDTTTLPNGRHELFNGVYSRASGLPPMGMGQMYITVDNGRAFLGVRPKYKDMFLSPGQSDTLTASLAYTDGFLAPATGVTYVSSNPAVASVSAAGLVTAVAPGVANITVQANGRSSQTRVYVTNFSGFPHFAKDGRILYAYDPAQSLFVRSLFFLTDDEMNSTPGLPQHVRNAGINAISTGFFNNPADNQQPDLASWQRSFDEIWNRKVSDAARYNMSLMLIGDDIARTPAELSFVTSSSWGSNALRHALTRARDSRVAVALDMVDEVSFVWGNTPKPTDGRWTRYSPSIPDSAFTTLMGIMNSVTGRTLVSWPIGGTSGELDVRNWLADPAFSGYSSSFFTYMDWRRGYPTASTIVQDRMAMQRVTADRFHLLQPNKPLLVQNSISGPFYTKLTNNSQYTPGVDIQQEPPNGVRAVAAQAMYAAVVGAAGIRSYGYDWTIWKQDRLRSPIGSTDQQTGSDPFSVGTDRWHSFGAAYSLIGKLERHLLQQRASSPELGGHVATTVRRSSTGRMLMAVNMAENSHMAKVDLTPYKFSTGSIMRSRQAGGSIKVEPVANAATEDTVTFEGGESISWVFLPAPAVTPGVVIQSPLPDATITGTINVQAAVSGTANLARVDFLVDGAVIRSTTAAPFTASFNAATVTPNIWHSLAVRVYDTTGDYNEARASIFTK